METLPGVRAIHTLPPDQQAHAILVLRSYGAIRDTDRDRSLPAGTSLCGHPASAVCIEHRPARGKPRAEHTLACVFTCPLCTEGSP